MRKTDGEWRKVTHSQREERGAVVGLDGCRIDAVGAAELDTGVELEREGGVETAGDAGPAAAACGGGVDGALEQRGGGVARGRGGAAGAAAVEAVEARGGPGPRCTRPQGWSCSCPSGSRTSSPC